MAVGYIITLGKMLEKIKNLESYKKISANRNIQSLGLVVFGVIVLLVTWSGIKAVQTNYELQKQISALQQQNQVKQLENQNLNLSNQYLNTDVFLELAARRNFGLALPGEKVILIPKEVALAHSFDLPKTTDKASSNLSSSKPKYQRNFEAWVDFFLHRPTVDN